MVDSACITGTVRKRGKSIYTMSSSIILSGVGGQGIILAAKIIAEAAKISGFPVCSNEIHGMAQRGGSVTAQVRFGEGVCSPLILEGTADVLASLEHIEALRWAHFLKPGGAAVISKQSIIPVTVSSGAAIYPSDVEERLKAVFPNLKYYDCVAKAGEMGDSRFANTILTGMVASALPLELNAWHKALEARIPEKLLDKNVEAFDFGRTI